MNAPPRIRTLRELGRGASGVVELGELETDFERWPAGHRVAVKTLHAGHREDRAARAAFEREARAGRDLADPSLAEVLYCGEGDDGPFLVMTFVPGASLTERLDREGRLPEPLVRRVGVQIAGALARLHAAGLHHADVKPDNVRLDEEGRAVLVDLGFADARESGEARDAGSLPYLSPERTRGGGPSPAADVFALGIVLYEAATGRHPFAPDAPQAGAERWLAALAEARYRPPSRWVPRLSPFLDACLAELLGRDPAERPSADEVRAGFEEGESGDWWRERAARGAGEEAPRTPEHLTALVGRARELEALESLWAELEVDRRGAVVWLEGAAGMGKSRLVEEFAYRTRSRAGPRARPPVYLYVRCTEFAESRPTGVLLDLVRRWLALPREAHLSPADREELERRLPPAEATALVSAMDPNAGEDFDAAALAPAVARWLASIAAETPTIVFVDDLHRASALTLRTLSHVVRGLENTGLYLVLGERPEETADERTRTLLREVEQRAERESGPGLRVLRLASLVQADVEALVERLFHSSAPRLRLARVLWLRSRGNPGLVAESLRSLLASGAAQPRGGGDPRAARRGDLVLTIRPEKLRLPGSLQRSIDERFRRLDEDERSWLERLAVVGGRILPDFLERAFPGTERAEVDETLARLERRGWLTAAGQRYRFARPALRDAIYRTVPERKRARMHAAAAAALEAGSDGAPTLDDAFQRAFHLHAAGEHRALLGELLELLESRLLRTLPQRRLTLARWGLEAVDALGKAAPASPPIPEEAHRLALLEVAADAADQLGLRAEERTLLDRLADHAPDPDEDPAGATRVYLLHARFAFDTGQFGLARGLLANAAHFAGRAGEAVLRSEVERRMANVLAQVGDVDEAERHARGAADLAASDRQWALARLASAQIALLDDRPADASRAVDEALRRLRRSDADSATGVRALAHLLRARIWRSAGRPGRALGAATRSLRLARAAGQKRLEAEAAARLGGLYLDLDRPAEAEDQLREALLVADDIEDRRGQILCGVFLGTLLWEEDHEGAHETVALAARRAHEIGYQRAEAVALTLLARMDREEGLLDRAVEASGRALALVAERGAEFSDRILVAGTRALVLRTAGRAKEAAAVERDLRRRIRTQERRLAPLGLGREGRRYSEEQLALVLSPQGPLNPRSR